MNKNAIRKLFVFGLLLLVTLTLSACDPETEENVDPIPDDPVVENTAPEITGTSDFTIEFGQNVDFTDGINADDEEDGDLTSSITIDTGDFDSEVAGTYDIVYTVEDSEGLSDSVTITVTVNEEEGPTAEEMIAADIAYYESNQFFSDEKLNLSGRGGEYQSSINWIIDTPYVADNGLILPPLSGSEPVTIEYSGEFSIGEVSVTETYSITINPMDDVVIAESRDIPFENLTTEYDVLDSSLTLYYEEAGEVPYVSVEDFFGILDGFIDPATDITFTEVDDTLTLFYQYYDEDEDHTYDLEVIIDATENTITTNDMGFYWAYVYSTETNYGRHIEYIDHVDEHSIEGENVVFSLDEYRMDIVDSEDYGILLPYYIVNQLFAGSSYYNVYYNYDGLYGIYSLPETSSDEFDTIHTSSKNDEYFPSDLLLHNYDVLAFNLDYFYGLKDFYGIETFYNLLEQNQDELLSYDADIFDDALFEFLYKTIDEPHTSYGYPSYYTKSYDTGPSIRSLADFGDRTGTFYDSLYAIDDEIGAKWGPAEGTSWNANSGLRPNYWFLDETNTSVVITLDSFSTADIVESSSFDTVEVSDVLDVMNPLDIVPEVTEGSKFFHYNSSTDSNNIFELIVKDVSTGYIDSYKALLDGLGYTLVEENTADDAKENGYYEKTVDGITYMVQVNYDSTYGIFYLGVADELPETYDDDWLIYADVMGTVKGDSAIYLEVIFDKLSEVAPSLENAMLDISWNTGGNVGALYRVVGFITDQPFRVSSISADSGSKYSNYVQIDGVPYNPNLNWSLLTSGVSFSAANSLATIFSENDLGPIIGTLTGGGTASITPVLLPSGTAFSMSSNSLSAIRTGTGTETDPYAYINNELGITPDIVITYDEIYDETVLITAFTD